MENSENAIRIQRSSTGFWLIGKLAVAFAILFGVQSGLAQSPKKVTYDCAVYMKSWTIDSTRFATVRMDMSKEYPEFDPQTWSDSGDIVYSTCISCPIFPDSTICYVRIQVSKDLTRITLYLRNNLLGWCKIHYENKKLVSVDCHAFENVTAQTLTASELSLMRNLAEWISEAGAQGDFECSEFKYDNLTNCQIFKQMLEEHCKATK